MEHSKIWKTFIVTFTILVSLLVLNILLSLQFLHISIITTGAFWHDKLALAKAVHSNTQTRSDGCKMCFKHKFKYLIQNESICKLNKDLHIDLVMVIFTEHRHTKERNAIRNTWTLIAKKNGGNVRYVFLLGKVNNENLMNAVFEENKVYGDLVMQDFADTYANLTYKTMMGLRWVESHCSDARFVMKTDDDMWVNVPELLKVLNSSEKELQTSIGGYCMRVAKPIRDQRSKWYASFKSYPQEKYPGFCSGTGYVTTMTVTKKLCDIFPTVPFFHLEDVYISLCIRKLGFTLRTLEGFHNSRTALNPCAMRSSKILTSHQVSSDFLYKVMAAKC